jgi:hypothetical protein
VELSKICTFPARTALQYFFRKRLQPEAYVTYEQIHACPTFTEIKPWRLPYRNVNNVKKHIIQIREKLNKRKESIYYQLLFFSVSNELACSDIEKKKSSEERTGLFCICTVYGTYIYKMCFIAQTLCTVYLLLSAWDKCCRNKNRKLHHPYLHSTL